MGGEGAERQACEPVGVRLGAVCVSALKVSSPHTSPCTRASAKKTTQKTHTHTFVSICARACTEFHSFSIYLYTLTLTTICLTLTINITTILTFTSKL